MQKLLPPTDDGPRYLSSALQYLLFCSIFTALQPQGKIPSWKVHCSFKSYLIFKAYVNTAPTNIQEQLVAFTKDTVSNFYWIRWPIAGYFIVSTYRQHSSYWREKVQRLFSFTNSNSYDLPIMLLTFQRVYCKWDYCWQFRLSETERIVGVFTTLSLS